MKNKVIKKYAAVIIDKGRFLIVKENGEDFWKNVGGKPEKEESAKQCIRRELKEELEVEAKKIRHYFTLPITFSVKDPTKKLRLILYCVKIIGEPKPNAEIEKIHWLTKEEFKNKKLKLTTQIRQYIVPKLISDKLLK